MRCSVATRQLQLYIDGRLSIDQIRVLEGHLVVCDACQRELFLLEEVASTLRDVKPVVEPADMTMRIMQRVAMTPQRQQQRPKVPPYSLLRPSLSELLAVILLATITTLGIIWGQPSLRAVLPFANGHDALSQAFFHILNMLIVAENVGALTVALWVGGTILGVCITLVLAGNDIRAEWLKAMMDRLPVR
jgi:predicted anti-sigma-YlaC factor YlaD